MSQRKGAKGGVPKVISKQNNTTEYKVPNKITWVAHKAKVAT